MAHTAKTFLKLDFAILDYIQTHMTSPLMDKIMPHITHLGSGGILWICLSLSFMMTKKYRRVGITVAAALILSLVICNLMLKPLTVRIRPFILGTPPAELMITPPRDFSFPSGHTAASFAAAVSIWLGGYTAFAYPALAVAALIGFSRLYLYVHYPSDVIFGALLGIVIAATAYAIVNLFVR